MLIYVKSLGGTQTQRLCIAPKKKATSKTTSEAYGIDLLQ